MFQNAFLFSEERYLQEKGYKQRSFFKPKVFISYCHDMWDSVVSDIIAGLETNNINFWLDRKDLVSGKWLLAELLSQIDESDICVTLLSRSFETSKYGKQELQLILDRSAGKKEWVFVKLDDINPDKVLPGLNARYYLNYADNHDINLIIQDICSRVAKLQNDQ